jgi:AmmeMemoRadiSam system protein B
VIHAKVGKEDSVVTASPPDLAKALADVVRGKRTVLVASSDFTHYEPADVVGRKDGALIKQILNMDVDGFYSTLDELNSTSCGPGAIATVMRVAESMGLKKAELLKHANSGDVSGDNLQVVGYGALRFV